MVFYASQWHSCYYCRVLLAFTIPTNESTTEISPLEKLEEKLHLPVNYFIMPIFALGILIFSLKAE